MTCHMTGSSGISHIVCQNCLSLGFLANSVDPDQSAYSVCHAAYANIACEVLIIANGGNFYLLFKKTY